MREARIPRANKPMSADAKRLLGHMQRAGSGLAVNGGEFDDTLFLPLYGASLATGSKMIQQEEAMSYPPHLDGEHGPPPDGPPRPKPITSGEVVTPGTKTPLVIGKWYPGPLSDEPMRAARCAIAVEGDVVDYKINGVLALVQPRMPLAEFRVWIGLD